MNRTEVQIDRYRKGTALIQVQHQDGQACAGAHVSVEQETHQFLFGGMVSGLSDFSVYDRERYHRRTQEVFNIVRREDHDLRVGANVLTLDLSNSNERMHLAEVYRELDSVNVPSGHGKPSPPKLYVYVSGRTIGLRDHQYRHGMEANDEGKAARYVAGLYTICFSHPSVRGLFWCGVSDREEGVSGGGLLRRDLSPKHAHKTLRKLIHVIWHTRARGETDVLGQFRFRGFFGAYRVVVVRQDTRPAIEQLYVGEEHHEIAISLPLAREER